MNYEAALSVELERSGWLNSLSWEHDRDESRWAQEPSTRLVTKASISSGEITSTEVSKATWAPRREQQSERNRALHKVVYEEIMSLVSSE